MAVLKNIDRIYIYALSAFLCIVFNISTTYSQDNSRFKSADEIESFFLKTRGPKEEPELKDMVLPLEVNFELNSAELTATSRKQLDNLAVVLLKPYNENLKMELAGHTCDLGGEAFNMGLSRKRINSAYRYLEEKYHINSSRLSTMAYGESLPIIANAMTEEERALNRRVVVYTPENRSIIERILKTNQAGLQWAVFHYSNDNKTHLVSYKGTTVLHSDDQYRVYIRPHKTKYVYVYQKDAHGNNEWLFPRADNPLKNPLKAGEYYLPDRSQVFILDENTGRETISILATDAPVNELEKLITGQSSLSYNDLIDQVIKTRGLKVTRIAPPPKGPDTQQGYIKISSNEKASQNKPQSADKLGQLMTQYGEFYMEIQFEHR